MSTTTLTLSAKSDGDSITVTFYNGRIGTRREAAIAARWVARHNGGRKIRYNGAARTEQNTYGPTAVYRYVML